MAEKGSNEYLNRTKRKQ